MALLALKDISKSYGTRLLFEGLSFSLSAEDRVGLVGVNGCGKSTLLHIIEGIEKPDSGSCSFSRGLVTASMEQSPEVSSRSLYETTLTAFQSLMDMEADILALEDALAQNPSDALRLIERLERLRERFADADGLTYKSRTRSMLLGLGFAEDELSKPLSTLSGGQRNKAQLALVLLRKADLLLLDEPTNHLDVDAIAFLEDFLLSYRGAYILVSHDRYFLDRVTRRTMELKNGRLHITEGNYSRHVELMSSENEIRRRHYIAAQREIRRIEGIIAQQRSFGRERNFVTIASKEKQIARLKKDLVAPEKESEGIRFHFQAKEVGGNDVLFCRGLCKAFEKPLFRGVDIHLRRGERVFLLGANGCGKTTLLRIIMGEEHADMGEISFGAHVHPGYYEQHMRSLHGAHSVLEEIRESYPQLRDGQLRNALAAFLFRGDDIEKKIENLSGGEKARIQLLKLMLAGDNLLLLDEPTNHLDLASREALEKALEEHEGAMLIVTHDRYLVNRLADRVLVLHEAGISEYLGGYDDYLASRRRASQELSASGTAVRSENEYQQKKKKKSAIHFAQGEVRRLEERIAAAEAELVDIRERMALHATEYEKVQSLVEEEKKKQSEIELLYEDWENAQTRLDALQAEED